MALNFNPDYIIVGGGTSGLVVANRLSEDPNTKVLILEAGSDATSDTRVNVPAFWMSLIASELDWDFETVPQANLAGRTNSHPAGIALGGSSAINGQAFVAPAKIEIDAWEKLGNPGWNWTNMVPFYKKMYTLDEPDQATKEHLGIDWINDEYRGSGPVKVSFPGVIQNPACKAWIDTFRGMNKLTTGDPFSGTSIGGYSNASTVDYTTKTRSFAASAYGSVLLERSNVKIVTGVRVSKILLSGEDGDLTASAVQVSVDGKEDTYTASRQIILAAGVFNTPKLLELSGIGNREILSQHGIRSIIDLPGVGESLQDHLMTGISYEAADGVMTGDDLIRQNPEALAAAQKLYEEHKTGPFSIGSIQSSAFMPLINASQSEVLAQFPPRPSDGEYDAIVRSIINKPDECTAVWFMFLSQSNLHADAKGYAGNTLQPENYASLGCWLSHPLSRGSSHIASADPTAKPRIDPKHLTHPVDLEILARHVQSLDMLRNRPELSTMFKPDGKRNHPDSFKVADLEIAKKYITESARGALHSCGTTSMMPRDMGGVVDGTLKVYGTTNLRVVDASIIPLIPRGNIISSVYAVAEKAADIIKSAQ